MQLSFGLLFTLGLSLCLGVDAVPRVRRGAISPQNGNEAIPLKYAFYAHPAACDLPDQLIIGL